MSGENPVPEIPIDDNIIVDGDTRFLPDNPGSGSILFIDSSGYICIDYDAIEDRRA